MFKFLFTENCKNAPDVSQNFRQILGISNVLSQLVITLNQQCAVPVSYIFRCNISGFWSIYWTLTAEDCIGWCCFWVAGNTACDNLLRLYGIKFPYFCICVIARVVFDAWSIFSLWQVIVCGVLLVVMAVGNFINTVRTLMVKLRFKAKMKKSKSKQELDQGLPPSKIQWRGDKSWARVI